MSSFLRFQFAAWLSLPLLVPALGGGKEAADDSFQKEFNVEKTVWSSKGTNPFFVLEPGYVTVFEGKEKGKTTVLTITVLNETKVVDGVETRVVEEKETVNGEVGEVSRNYFAMSKSDGGIYYFGEDSATYERGKVKDHGGSWLAGVNGAHFGLAMPGHPEKGMKYYQEVAPKVAMDRAEIVSTEEVVTTPAGEFKHCLKISETTPIEKGKEYKYYAPGIGLVVDDELKLTKIPSAK